MRRVAIITLALAVAGCGVQRPLMRPKDVPAYQEELRKRRENMIEEQKQLKAIDAQRAAEKAAKQPDEQAK